MSNLQLLVIFTLFAEANVAYGKKKDCVVANFQFQRNFDMKRYPGFVYHQLSILDFGRAGISFIRRLRNDTVSSIGSTRSPTTGLCQDFIFVCKNDRLGSPKIRVTDINQPEPFTSTVYVAATDYRNYLIFYMCLELNMDGTCKNGNIVTETLTPSIRRRDVRLSKYLAQKYCLNPSKLINLQANKACPEALRLRAVFEKERREKQRRRYCGSSSNKDYKY